MKLGASISGGVHTGLLVFALWGADWFAPRDPIPLVVTEVELVDGADFDARLSTAPVIENEGPAELRSPSESETDAGEVATPEDAAQPSDLVALAETEAPEPQPDEPQIVIPPPPTDIPTEAPAPSIAEIPSPDPLERQASEPESPPATEPLQPLATAAAPQPAPKPTPPPEPEPEIEETTEPEPVEEQAPDPEAVAEAEPEPEPAQEPEPEAVVEAQTDAPLGPAPQEARLPVAKPADLAAAARAAAKQEQVAAKPAEPDKPREAQSNQSAGGSTARFAAIVTQGEKDALRLGIKRYFTFSGNRSDRTLAVVIAVRLDKTGKISGKPELLRAQGADKSAQNALFQAGRRALLRAQAAGEFSKLPPDKHQAWKLIHVTFTPENIGFAS